MAIKELIRKILKSPDVNPPSHFTNFGSTGTENHGGRFQEEYLPTFASMPSGIKVLDEMRRSDYQIKMLLRAIKQPIESANWSIEPAKGDNEEEEKEIAEFVRFCLFEDICYPDGNKKKNFTALIKEILTSLEFGYSLFEPIHKIVMNHPTYGNYIGLKDIAFRSQKTIQEWNLNPDGSINNVYQQAYGELAVDVKIEGKNLIVFSHDKEGDNYEGISLLRPIYGNWFRKNFYFKIQAIGMERSATGVPYGKIPNSVVGDKEQRTAFINVLKNYSSGQNSYIMTPEGYEVEVFKLTHNAKSVEDAINNEDIRMSKSIMAGFLELGMNGGGGSESLSKDLSTIFLNGLEVYSKSISETLEYHVIKKLVDAKYGVRKKYPKLVARDINDKVGEEYSKTIKNLLDAGAIAKSDQLEDAMNKMFNLPETSHEDKEQRSEKPKEQNDVKAKLSESTESNATFFIKAKKKELALMMQIELNKRKEKHLVSISKKLTKETNVTKRRKILKESSLPDKKKYKETIGLQIATVAKQAFNSTLVEVGKPNLKLSEYSDELKLLPLALREKLKITIETIIEAQDKEIENRMFFVATQKLDTADSVNKVIDDMDKTADKYIGSGVISTTATNVVSTAVNSARNEVFQTKEVFDEIESFIIVNPSPDALICKNLQGRVFSKEEYKNADLPPYHHNCETTVKAQLIGQKNIKPTNPIGLTPTGTEEEITNIIKSKTF